MKKSFSIIHTICLGMLIIISHCINPAIQLSLLIEICTKWMMKKYSTLFFFFFFRRRLSYAVMSLFNHTIPFKMNIAQIPQDFSNKKPHHRQQHFLHQPTDHQKKKMNWKNQPRKEAPKRTIPGLIQLPH